MKFEITYSADEFAVDSSFIKGITLKASIEDLYIVGKVILYDPYALYAPHIKLGELVNISLREDDKNQIVRSYSMRILDYTKASDEENPLMIKSMEIHLISDWFFDQVEKTTAYKGSVSTIILELLQKESFFKNRRIFADSSSDDSTVRYQIRESQGEFISKIVKYGLNNNSPLFAYMDLNENFNLKSWESMKSDNTPYVLAPRKAEDGPDLYASKGSTLIPMYGYSFFGNGDDMSASRIYTFTTEHIPYNPPKKVTVDMVAKDVATKKREKISNTYPWYVNPQDALGLAIRDVKTKDWGLTQMVVITDSLIISDISVGKSITVAHQQSSLSEIGSHVIQSLDEIWSPEGSFTRLHLIKV